MKRRLLLLPFLFLLGAAPALKIEVQERHGKSYRGTIDAFPLLMLRATQRERGEAHGRLAAATILAMLDFSVSPQTAVSALKGRWIAPERKDVFGN